MAKDIIVEQTPKKVKLPSVKKKIGLSEMEQMALVAATFSMGDAFAKICKENKSKRKKKKNG